MKPIPIPVSISFLFLILSLLLPPETFAQVTYQPARTDVFPPTPNAASLGKFGDIPVGYSNGIPSITVPIYNYESPNGLKLAISLDYHAGGVKVDEIASDIGIGFALQYGGSVSRVVRGIPDDTKRIGYFYMHHLSDPSSYIRNYCGQGLICPQVDSADMFYKNKIDNQSDVFSYSFNGKSGKFIYGLDGNYVTIPQSKIKIERVLDPNPPNNKTLLAIMITDLDGTKYYFEKDETIYSSRMFQEENPGVFTYSSSWFLSKIVSPFKTDSIQFSYESIGISYQSIPSETQYISRNNSNNYTPNPARTDYSSAEFNGTTQRIKSILLPTGYSIDFNYETTDRKDISTKGALKEIIINNASGSYGFRLWHSYGPTVAYDPAPTNVSSSLRLRLDSVAQFSSNTFLPPYKFTYNGTPVDRTSRAIDLWGFPYNPNRSNSNTLIPISYVGLYNKYDGSDRSPDPEYVQKGALTRIQYPTGGTTEFQYEINQAGDGKLIKKIPTKKSVSFGSGLIENGYSTFTLNREFPSDGIQFSLGIGGWCFGLSTTCHVLLKVTDLAGTKTYIQGDFTYTDGGPVTSGDYYNVPNGDYKITYSLAPSGCNCQDIFHSNLSWVENKSDTTQYAGGLRIKMITNYDGLNHGQDVIKEFSYLNSKGKSSGVVLKVPSTHDYSFQEQTFTRTDNGGCIPMVTDFLVRNSDVSFVGFDSKPIVYGTVTVREKNGATYNGKTVYSSRTQSVYSAPACADGVGNCFPYAIQPATLFDFGLPVSEDYYNSTGMKLKSIKSEYGTVDTEVYNANFISFKLGAFVHYIPTEGWALPCSREYDFRYPEFYPLTGRVFKKREYVVDYVSATDSVVTDTYNVYDDTYYNLKSTYRYNSLGQKIEQRLYYPYDYSISGAIGKLKSAGIIEPVISKETWQTVGTQNKILEANITDYQELSNKVIRPSHFYVLNTDQPLLESTIGLFNGSVLNRNTTYFQEETFYEKYDGKGNILQIDKRGQKQSFLWDYKNQLAIAKIDNATQADIAYTGFEADGGGNWQITSRTPNTTSYKTGSQSYDLVSTASIVKSGLTASIKYVLSYWALSGTHAVKVNGTLTATPGTSWGGWTYYEISLSNVTSITLSGTGTIDELRLCPSQSSLFTTYAYSPGIGVTSVTDSNNLSSYYKYDLFGRLVVIRDDQNKVVKQFQYHYKK